MLQLRVLGTLLCCKREKACSPKLKQLDVDKMGLKLSDIDEAIRKVRELAYRELAKGKNADEFVQIGEADGFKLYVVAGKTISKKIVSLHENPRDVFMLLLEGNMEFAFENGEKATVKKGQYFVLPKHVRHSCTFKKMTIALEGVYEKGL
jgi:quercetin dioxygenase-like cupin family protein